VRPSSQTPLLPPQAPMNSSASSPLCSAINPPNQRHTCPVAISFSFSTQEK
jgi:hypothetical protein